MVLYKKFSKSTRDFNGIIYCNKISIITKNVSLLGGRRDLAFGSPRRSQQSDSEGSVQFAAERDEPERRTIRHLPDHWRQSGYSRSQPAQSIRSVNGDSDYPLSAFSPFLILTELKRTKYNRKHILDIGLQYELHNCIALF